MKIIHLRFITLIILLISGICDTSKAQTFDGKLFEETMINEGQKRMASRPSARMGSFSEIIFSVKNVSLTGTTPKYLNFDIYVQSSNSETYLDNCILRLYYDSLMLGTNVNANGKISVTKAPAFSNGIYTFLNYDVNWYANNLLGIGICTQGNNLSLGRTQITTTETKLISCRIEVKNCMSATSLSLAQFYQDKVDFNINKYIYYTLGATVSGNYELFNYDNIQTQDVFGGAMSSNICQTFNEGFNNYGSPFVDANIVSCSTTPTTINAGAYVYAQATSSIDLKPGFTVKAGSQFSARIKSSVLTSFNCGTPPARLPTDESTNTTFGYVYPNPNSTRVVNVEKAFADRPIDAVGYVQFISMSGISITKELNEDSGYQCNVAELSSGLYVIKIFNGERFFWDRIVLE